MPGPDVGGSGAHKVVARYPMGAQVMVYYNPQNPSEALLDAVRRALSPFCGLCLLCWMYFCVGWAQC